MLSQNLSWSAAPENYRELPFVIRASPESLYHGRYLSFESVMQKRSVVDFLAGLSFRLAEAKIGPEIRHGLRVFTKDGVKSSSIESLFQHRACGEIDCSHDRSK